jgi:hypothetical protein
LRRPAYAAEVKSLIAGLGLVIGLAGCSSVVGGSGTVGGTVGSSRPSGASPAAPSSSGSSSSGPASSGPASSPTPASPSTASGPLIRYRGDRFSILLPGAPIASELPVKTPQGTMTAHLLSVEESLSEVYIVAYTDYPRTALLSLDGAAQGAAAKADGRVQGLRRIVYRNEPGRDFRVDSSRGLTIFVRLVVVGHRLYQLQFLERGAHAAPPAEFLAVRASLRF